MCIRPSVPEHLGCIPAFQSLSLVDKPYALTKRGSQHRQRTTNSHELIVKVSQ